MSFQDYRPGGVPPLRPSATQGGAAARDPLSALGATLQQYDRHVDLLRSLLAQRNDHAAARSSLEPLKAQLAVLEELRAKAGEQLRALTSSSRATLAPSMREAARARTEKLAKDLERIRAKHGLVVQSMAPMLEAAPGRAGARGDGAFGQAEAQSHSFAPGAAAFGQAVPQRQLQQQQQQSALQEVDDAAMQDYLIRQRAQEIGRLNADLHSINEIFADLSTLVESQSEAVEDIGRTMEAAHSHAARGLEQVEQANRSQQGCVVT